MRTFGSATNTILDIIKLCLLSCGMVQKRYYLPIMGGQVQHFRFLTCREGPGCVEVFALQWATNCQLFFMIPGEHHHLPTFKAYIEWVPATTDVVAVVSEPK